MLFKVLHKVTSVGKKMMNGKDWPNSTGPETCKSPNSTVWKTLQALAAVFQASYAGKSDAQCWQPGYRGARQISETRYAPVLQTWILHGLSSPKSPGEHNEEDKEDKGDDTQDQPPPQCQWCWNFYYWIWYLKNPNLQKEKETKAVGQSLRIHVLPRLNRAGLNKCWLTVFTIIYFLIQKEEMKWAKTGAED